MEGSSTDDGTLFEPTIFLIYFNELPDSRQPGKVVYFLDEVLLFSLACGCRNLHLHRPVRRQKACPAAPVPPFP